MKEIGLFAGVTVLGLIGITAVFGWKAFAFAIIAIIGTYALSSVDKS